VNHVNFPLTDSEEEGRVGEEYGVSQGRIRQYRFKGKKRNNKGGAVTENGKRSKRRMEESSRDKEKDENARTRTSLGMRETNCRKGEQGWRTVGMLNDRELQVMASNAAYLTPPPYPITRNNLCVPVNIFLSSLAKATRREIGLNQANNKCELLSLLLHSMCECIRCI